jgi:hypothetical protein
MKDKKKDSKNKRSHATEELRDSGGMENASASRGGTTDMDNGSSFNNRRSSTERGSGLTTKKNITGSDYDGQNSD